MIFIASPVAGLRPLRAHPAKAMGMWCGFQVGLPQDFRNFLPESQGHGSLRPILLEARPDQHPLA
jgi:hypothetical protein